MRTHWVMDYETLSNCFIAVFEAVNSEEQKIFVVHESQNDILELVDFLQENISSDEWHVSFNGLGFDSQITEYILRNRDSVIHNKGEVIAKWIYGKAQNVIGRQNAGEFLEFSPRDLQINQVDVFKLNHWDNNAKRSSLKWIQYTMDWPNIIDMPIHHTETISAEQIPEVIRYCINDVKSTKQIMKLSKDQIGLRKTLTDEYGINLFSASEPRISKELFLHFLSQKLEVKKWDLRQARTHRARITVKNIILPYIEFKTATFQNLLNKFNEVVIYPGETKGGFKYSVQYKGVKTDYGLGGIHGARSTKVYESNEDMVIMTSDVTSFYPNLAIRNKWAPAHLPKDEFCDLYEWFFEERKKIPKSDPKNYVYKIILNSTYGLSNDENSFLYDPEFTMRITINGQLSLSMLYEMICEEIPNAIPLMQNTDGLETLIPREYVDKYMDICKRWEDITQLQLEHDTYSKIILGDVNNYIAVTEDGKSKCKGRFEYNNLALHKNKSFLIIPKAIHAYFVDGIEPEDFLAANQNIFDYCGGVKIKGDWNFFQHGIFNGEPFMYLLQHTIRYFVSKSGSKIIKKNNTDGREIQVEAGKWMQTIMIDYQEKDFSEYDINFKYYLDNIYKEIRSLEPINNQLSLF
jgi:hypothetical protein